MFISVNRSRFVFPSDISPERRSHTQEMLDRLKNDRARHRAASKEAIAESAGFIAISAAPLTISTIADKTERDYSVIKRAVGALHYAGFIEKDVPVTNDGNGSQPTLLTPLQELYEGIAITPEWQDATRICTLAAMTNMTVREAVNQAVSAQLNSMPYAWVVA